MIVILIQLVIASMNKNYVIKHLLNLVKYVYGKRANKDALLMKKIHIHPQRLQHP